jgi:hypothetical protein
MLTKGTLNRQNRQQGKLCDAGSVAMGIDDSNRYHILKTNDNGELLINTTPEPFEYNKTTYYGRNDNFPIGLQPIDALLFRLNLNLLNTENIGLINFVPNLFLQAINQPVVNLYIINRDTDLGNYVTSLPLGGVFAPDISLIANNPLLYFKHQIRMEKISNTLNNYSIPLSAIQDKFCLNVNDYLIFAVLDNSITITNSSVAILVSF